MKSSVVASLGLKAAIGGTVLLLASAGSAVAMKATGTAMPAMPTAHTGTNRGMSETVENCKTQVRGTDPDPNGTHKQRGIGDCVSDAAMHHGKAKHAAAGTAAPATASPSPTPGKHLGQNDAQPSENNPANQGQGNGNAQGNNTNGQGKNGNGQGNNGNGQAEGQSGNGGANGQRHGAGSAGSSAG